MKLGKLIVIEIALVVILLFAALNLIAYSPFLVSSSQDPGIGLLKEIVFPPQNVTLLRDQVTNILFNYSSYEPAILIMDINYLNWETSGYITIFLNGRFVGNIQSLPDTKQKSLAVVSCSGIDWVRPNESNFIMFLSEYDLGYEGTFTCSVKLRGSR